MKLETIFEDFYYPGMDWFDDDKRNLSQVLVLFTDVGFIGKIWAKTLTEKISFFSCPDSWFLVFYRFITIKDRLGGGNSNIFHVHPDPWGNDPI